MNDKIKLILRVYTDCFIPLLIKNKKDVQSLLDINTDFRK